MDQNWTCFEHWRQGDLWLATTQGEIYFYFQYSLKFMLYLYCFYKNVEQLTVLNQQAATIKHKCRTERCQRRVKQKVAVIASNKIVQVHFRLLVGFHHAWFSPFTVIWRLVTAEAYGKFHNFHEFFGHFGWINFLVFKVQ